MAKINHGLDELASREELVLVTNLLIAKFREQAELLSELFGLLEARGYIKPHDIENLTDRLKHGDRAKKAKQSYANLDEFLTIRKISQRYLDPPEE